MTWLRILKSRLAALFRKDRLEQELDEELRSHLEMRTNAKGCLRGKRTMPPGEALAASSR